MADPHHNGALLMQLVTIKMSTDLIFLVLSILRCLSFVWGTSRLVLWYVVQHVMDTIIVHEWWLHSASVVSVVLPQRYHIIVAGSCNRTREVGQK